MITRAELVPFILKAEPDFEAFCKQEREYWKMETPNRDMASFSIFIEEKLRNSSYKRSKAVFEAVEFLLRQMKKSKDNAEFFRQMAQGGA